MARINDDPVTFDLRCLVDGNSLVRGGASLALIGCDEFEALCDEVDARFAEAFRRGYDEARAVARLAVAFSPTLGADAREIEVGQIVYGGDGRAWQVTDVNPNRAGGYSVRGRLVRSAGKGEGGEFFKVDKSVVRDMKPGWLTHEKPGHPALSPDHELLLCLADVVQGYIAEYPDSERIDRLARAVREVASHGHAPVR